MTPEQQQSLCPECRTRLFAMAAANIPKSRVKRIMSDVEEVYKLPHGSLSRKTRAVNISHPRQVAMMVAREAGCTPSDIARTMDLDHTSVIYGIKAARKRLEAIA